MKLLRACALVIAIACTAQAGEMDYGFASHAPDLGTQILLYLSLWF